ncbi:O-Antigen ligase [Anaerovirgula multivorans]|uniref:O-Antigen ligase n=1 Tax=Anaerovirgula multivorans TaxID=312168 RepID=A0A239EGH9_9FIRM|nr:O-antigen ligase family protein [Anaerovirgula multivorans]SNS43765.1 O-Antigen ligase [Anaerovirgula multivorans]
MKAKELKKKNKSIENKLPSQAKGKGMIVFALLCILLFYPPFFKGLFFEKEILFTHILSFGLFIIYLTNKITKGEKITFNSPFDYIGVFFIIAYLFPIVFKQWANLRDAIGVTLRYANFFVVYLMVKEYAQEEKYKNWILDVFITSGVGTAIIGLLGAAGYVKLQDVVLGNRISSTFQYPNTLAAFLMTLFFITTGKQALEEKLWKKNLYAAAGFIMVFTFIFTYSRTAWVLFPIFAILYLGIIPSAMRIKTIFYYIAVGLPSLLLLQPFTNYTSNIEEKSPRAVLVVVIGIAMFLGIYTGLQFVIQKLENKHLKKIYIGLASIVVIFAILITTAFNMTKPLTFDNTNVTEDRHNQIHRIIRNVEANQDYNLQIDVDAISDEEGQWPWRIKVYGFDGEGQQHTLLTRNGENEENGKILIPFTTNEDTEKLAIYFDNVYPGTKVTFNEARLLTDLEELVKDIKLSYQFIPENIISRINVLDLNQQSFTTRTAYYRDSFTIFKSYPIFGAGGGAWNGLYTKYQSEPYFSTEAHNYFLQTLVELGIAGVLLMIGLLGTILALFILLIKKKDLMQMTILFGVLSLLTHSALDFNFSYLSIPLLMWGLIALVDVESIKDINKTIKNKFNKQIHSLIPLVLILPLIFIAVSFYGGHQSAASGIRVIQQEGDFEKGYALLENAITRDPFNKDFRADIAQLQIMVGEQNQEQVWFQMAEENLQAAMKYVPYNDNILQQIGQVYLSYGEFDRGFEYIEKMIEVAPMRPTNYEAKVSAYTTVGNHYLDVGEKGKAVEMFEKAVSIVEDVKAVNVEEERTIVLNQETMDGIFKARYVLENIDDKDKLAKLEDMVYISYPDLDVDGDGISDGWRISQPMGGNIIVEITESGLLITNDGEAAGMLISQQMNLEPSRTYGISMQVSGDTEDNYMSFRIISRNGKSMQFYQSPLGQAIKDNTYSFTFETTEDIGSGAQEIRFYHDGNTDKAFTVRKVIIYEVY